MNILHGNYFCINNLATLHRIIPFTFWTLLKLWGREGVPQTLTRAGVHIRQFFV